MTERKTQRVLTHPGTLSVYFFLSIALFLNVVYQIWRGHFLPEDISAEQTSLLRLIIYTFCFGGIPFKRKLFLLVPLSWRDLAPINSFRNFNSSVKRFGE